MAEHLLVVANETAGTRAFVEAVKERAGGDVLVTLVAPVNTPREGYVVYEDTRRASAGRRLDRALGALRDEGVPAQGFVTDAEPADAVRDALATVEPPVTRVLVTTHPLQRSGWLRRKSSTASVETSATCRSTTSRSTPAARRARRRTCS